MKELKSILKKTKIYHLYIKIITIIKTPKNLTYKEKADKISKKYSSKIFWNQEGNDKLLEILSSSKPIFITRFGSVELNTLIENQNNSNYSDNTFYTMQNNAGFFPISKKNLDKFSDLYYDSIQKADCVAVWFNQGEYKILNKYNKNAFLIELGCLNSFLFNNPYTQILKNKKILIIHPFINTIEKQLKTNKNNLFSNPLVLPDFEYEIIKAPQTIAGNTDGYSSWFEAFEDTCKKIDKCTFDIALLGCGAYGLPLGAYIKSKGKTAIHIGGALQLLFGIKGRRWETEYDYKDRFFNDYWIYPLESDTPANSNNVENNCY